MLFVILCILIGCLLMIKRLYQCKKVYVVLRKRWKQKTPLYRVHTSRFSILSFSILCVLSLLILVTNYQNPQICAIGNILTFISFGELCNAFININFYYDNEGFYYYHTYLYYHNIKELRESKGLFGFITVYNVKIGNALFSVSKEAYRILLQKNGEIKQKCAK